VSPARLEREIRSTTDAALRVMARGQRDLARILWRRVAELVAMRAPATVRKLEREKGLT
jgi:hypothetical protein